MNKTICGANCSACIQKGECKGCVESCANPFGLPCFVADYIKTGGEENFLKFKQTLMEEINSLNVDGMEKIQQLYPLVGKTVNMWYRLPNGRLVKFLNDNEIYLGTQAKCIFSDTDAAAFGVVANNSFILVCEFFKGVTSGEIVLYKRR